MKKITGSTLPDKIINRAFTGLNLTYDPLPQSLYVSAERVYDLGFLGKTKPNLSGIYDLHLLNEVLKELELPVVATK